MKFTLALTLAVTAASAAYVPPPAEPTEVVEPTEAPVPESSYKEKPVPESTYEEEPAETTPADDGPEYSMFSHTHTKQEVEKTNPRVQPRRSLRSTLPSAPSRPPSLRAITPSR